MTISLHDLKAYVAQQAAADAAFRAELLANPKAAVEQLLKADLPAHVTIEAVEEAPDTYIVVLPAPAAAGELSDADLESVAGGTSKAQHDHNAKKAASLVFGLGFSVAADVMAAAAQAAGNEANQKKLSEAGRDFITCGAR